jgi:hypothetical protein
VLRCGVWRTICKVVNPFQVDKKRKELLELTETILIYMLASSINKTIQSHTDGRDYSHWPLSLVVSTSCAARRRRCLQRLRLNISIARRTVPLHLEMGVCKACISSIRHEDSINCGGGVLDHVPINALALPEVPPRSCDRITPGDGSASGNDNQNQGSKPSLRLTPAFVLCNLT